MTTPGPFLFVPALLARAETHLIARLREARATVPSRAVALHDLTAPQQWRLSRLEQVGAVQRAVDGRVYLDEAVYALYRGHRQRMVAIAIGAAVLAAIMVAILFGGDSA
ncbi:MAG TPA: hypothetical protein VIL35_05285 [Vicinamibacterales bacterium]